MCSAGEDKDREREESRIELGVFLLCYFFFKVVGSIEVEHY